MLHIHIGSETQAARQNSNTLSPLRGVIKKKERKKENTTNDEMRAAILLIFK